MEEDNDLEQVTGSPTAGENEFVHIESVDSAQMDGASINQVENLEQDDGVVITGVDTMQDEPHAPRDVKTSEDVGHDEFVDCPENLVYSEARSPGYAIRPHQHPFMEYKQIKASEIEKEIVPQDYEEERKVLMEEVSNLHHQLKVLSKQQSVTDGNEAEEGGEKSILPLREMVNECSKFIEISLNEQSQAEGATRELYATIHMKDKEIEDLMVKVNDQSTSQDEVKVKSNEISSFEAVTDGILSNLAIAFGEVELPDTSVSGKLSYVEKSTHFLLEKYSYFLSEVEMLGHCLAEVNPGFQMQNGLETVFPYVREELVGLKRKEFELNDKNTLLESQHAQLLEQLEQEKTRYNNTKEKLSMAVTKGKALVQQRDSLKQTVAEKTSELEKCLIELQEKSTALESRNIELTQSQILANSLQEAIFQRDIILTKCAEILSLGLPEASQFPNLEGGVSWLLESYNLAKDHFFKLQNENIAIKEDARVQIDSLTASLITETQEKYHLKQELEEMTQKYEKLVEDSTESSHIDKELLEKIQYLIYVKDLESKLYEQILDCEMDNRSNDIVKVSEEIRVLKDERNSLQINLQKSEEKASLLREKLSLAVKKGKGLVQERENMKQQMSEKNAQIEALMVGFQKQESTLSEQISEKNTQIEALMVDFRKQESTLSEQMAEKNAQIEALMVDFQKQESTLSEQMSEKNTQIEALMVDFQKQESTLSDFRDQIAKLESEKDQIGQYLAQSNTILQEIVDTIDGINIIYPLDVELPIEKVKYFAMYLSECEIAKTQVEQELEDVKDEAGQLTSKLTEALTTMKSLEEHVSQISEEKRELEISKNQTEQELEISKEEISTLNNKLVETLKTLKSLEDKLASSEKTISLLTEDKSELETAKCHIEKALSVAENNKEEAQVSKIAAEKELQEVKQQVSVHVSNLDEAKKTIMSLQDAMSSLKANVSEFTQENEKAIDSKTLLETEIKKLKDEAELEISTLKTELSTCRQELLVKNDKCAPEILDFFGNLKVYLEDESLLSLFKQSFEKKIKNLKEIDRILIDMNDNFDSEQLQDYPAIEENFPAGFKNNWNSGLIDVEFNPEDTENISSYVGKTLDNLNTKNQILTDQFSSFSTLADVIIASLLKKLEKIRNTMQENAKNMQMDKQMQDNRVVMLEQDINVLVSVCADVTKDLEFHFDNNIELEKSNPRVVDDVAIADVKVAANELYFASRNIQSVIEQHVSVKENMSTKFDGLQSELEKTSLLHDKSKQVIEELQGELEKSKLIYEKLEEENDAFQRKVFELEAELEASGNTCNELTSKLEDYRAKEDELDEIKRQLSAQSISSVKNLEEDTENALLSASQIKTLFGKIDGITTPFPNLVVGDIQPENSDSVNKLFYIIDNVNELLDQLTLLTHAKDDLRSTLSKQALEVDQLEGEFKDGLQNIIQKFGGDEFVGVKKPADVAGQLSVLEKLVQGIVLDRENSRFKLVETQKIAEELSNKVKLLEDFNKKRTSGSDLIQERGVFEDSLPGGSEISEIDDQVPVGKAGLPLVPSAAQMRSLRKGSNDQLAITIDSESDRLLDKSQTVEDKGHVFKSLHTSGLVPVQGKMIADRLDGIWVSGSRGLMRQPRARLGVIAYWLVLHLWLLGTIL